MNFDDYTNTFPYANRRENPEVNATFRAESRRLLDQFKVDALEEVGLTNHPKAERAWEMAWDKHGSGLSDVFYYLEELASLIL